MKDITQVEIIIEKRPYQGGSAIIASAEVNASGVKHFFPTDQPQTEDMDRPGQLYFNNETFQAVVTDFSIKLNTFLTTLAASVSN